jgi:vacuolar-type H+-ATPase subunit H
VLPEDITQQRFSRAFLGADLEEVRQALARLAAAAKDEIARAESRSAGLEGALRGARARIERLEQELAAVREQLAAAESSLTAARQQVAAQQEREGQVVRVLLDAQRLTDEITRTARTDADEALARARDTAEETLAEARRKAAQMLRDARRRARAAVRAADELAARHRLDAEAEADDIVSEARAIASRHQQAAEQEVERLIARVEETLALRTLLPGDLETLVRRHTDVLDRITGLFTEAQRDVLPVLARARLALRGKPGAVSPAPAHATPEPARSAAPAAPAPAAEPAGLGTDSPARGVQQARAGDPHAADRRMYAEVCAGPFGTLLDATKFSVTLSRLPGVAAARLEAFSNGTATIEMVLKGLTPDQIDASRIPGYPARVVEAGGSRLILRLLEPEK